MSEPFTLNLDLCSEAFERSALAKLLLTAPQEGSEQAYAGPVFWANQAICRLLGYTRHELLSKNLIALCPTADRPRRILSLQGWLAGQEEPDSLEIPLLHHQGQLIWTRMTPSVLYDRHHKPSCLVLEIQDIGSEKFYSSARMAVLERLLRAETMSGLGSWELDLVAGMSYGSEQCYRILGLEPAEFSLAPQGGFGFLLPQDREPAQASFAAAIARQAEVALVSRIQRADGEFRYVFFRGQVRCNEQGVPKGIGGYLLDITALQLQAGLQRETSRLVEWQRRQLVALAGGLSAQLRRSVGLLNKLTEDRPGAD